MGNGVKLVRVSRKWGEWGKRVRVGGKWGKWVRESMGNGVNG